MHYTLLNAAFLSSVVHLVSASYTVVISNDSPVTRGATVHFGAELFENGKPADGSFKFEWEDNSVEGNTASHETKSNTDTWNVTYAKKNNPLGVYTVQVTVYKFFLFYYAVTSERQHFNLTEDLNGQLELVQQNKLQKQYISNAQPVLQLIQLNGPDSDYLKNATSLYTFWFVDCIYYGPTSGLNFTMNYTDVEKMHHLEALVVAGFGPVPHLPIATNSSLNSTTTTTSKPKIADKVKRDISLKDKNGIKVWKNGTLVPYNGTFPYVCQNDTIVPPDPSKTYGYFTKDFTTKTPISNFSVSGNYWLQQGNLLNLDVKCQGSPQFYYCKHIFEGAYNVTGNETCSVPPSETLDKCEFIIQHLFTKSTKYTIVIIIYNDVGKVVQPVTVTIYHVTKQAQLSVIVIPVVFSLVAIVLIIFGIAYYVQNRNRFIVEVADFNFGQQYNDLEYKTFRERLRDSISNAFTRPMVDTSEPTTWPPGRKYGSLT